MYQGVHRSRGIGLWLLLLIYYYTALSLAAQCIVIGPVCGFATGGRASGGRRLLPR